MTPEELFTAALGLGRQWRVAECRFEGEPKRLELRLQHVPGEHFECPQCKALCGVHDTLERRWRHLNFFQYRCELVAKVPRTWCRKDGVHQVQVPWAREGSGFTLLMEALVMCLSAQMPVDGIADLLQESDTRLWRVLIHYVEQARGRRDWKTVRRIAVDETSARRGHRYVTNVLDCDGAGLLLMVEGRSSQTLGCFAQALREHGGDPRQIQAIAMDMSPAYLKGAAEHFPQAQIVFELRETLQAIYASPDQLTAESQLHWWCGWALRSRLEPFRTLAKTLRQHWHGILAYFQIGLTSAAIEAVNGVIQLAKRMARGFKKFVYFRTAAYLRAGRLKFELPVIN